MHLLIPILQWFTALCYAAGTTLYFKHLVDRTSVPEKWLKTSIPVTLTVHLAYLVSLSLVLGHAPIGDIPQVLTSTAWLFTLVYFGLEHRSGETSIGGFILGISTILHVLSSIFLRTDKPLAAELTDLTFEVHVSAMLLAYTAFGVSFIASLLFIFLYHEINEKRFGFFYTRLPSLDFFDRLSNQAVNIGLIFAAFGIALGVYLGKIVWVRNWWWDPKLLSMAVLYVIYLGHLLLRKTVGWQGKRAAMISICGFNWLLVSWLIISPFLSRLHKY
jgi:ABC-type transport system involved in cytochrome c biogenesis permease subunit